MDIADVIRISGIVSSALSLDEMLGEIIRLTVQVTNCDACLVYLIERESNEVVLRASQVPHAADMGRLRMKIGEGVTGWVAERNSVVVLSDKASSDSRFKCFPALVEDTYQALLSVPLVSGGEVIGVINVHHRQPHRHTQAEVALLIFVGEQMGGAIAKSILAEENARLAGELETRKLVERAKGILQQKYGMTEAQAYSQLRAHSRRSRRPIRELAEALLIAEELGAGPRLTE